MSVTQKGIHLHGNSHCLAATSRYFALYQAYENSSPEAGKVYACKIRNLLATSMSA